MASPFSWKKHTDALLQKKLYRVSRLAAVNTTFKIEHANLVREVEQHTKPVMFEKKATGEMCCDFGGCIELKSFCEKQIKKQLKRGLVPVVDRPMRLNRVD